MKISQEAKIGFVVFIILALFIWAYNFMKGKDLLSSSSNYYVLYDEISGLEESSPVTLNGYKVGTVSNIEFVPGKTGELKVRLSVEKQVNLPANTVALIYNSDLLGTKAVKLVTGKNKKFIENGDTLTGKIETGIQEKLEEQLFPLKEKTENLIVSFDSVLSIMKSTFNKNFSDDLGESVSHINNTLGALDTMVTKENGSLAGTMTNIESITDNIEKNNDELTKTLKNLASVSDSISQSNIRSTIDNLNSSLDKLNSILLKINEGKGTAGKIVNNDSLYTQLTLTIESMNLLLKDLKENPKKYVHFSLFGGNQKEKKEK